MNPPIVARRAFTLIEILIVIVIVGILAALVVPQFVNAGDMARRNSLVTQLQTIRTQIARYKAQHNQALPNIRGGLPGTEWTALTGQSTGAGNRLYGPYLDKPQVNPLNGLSTVTISSGAAPTAPCGWVYDYGSSTSTGRLWATGSTGVRYFNELHPSEGDLDSPPGS